MTTPADDAIAAAYDELGLLHENAAEAGLPFDQPPTVARVATALPDGRTLSALRWGAADPEVVLLHGGGQNAHTWDTVALALGLPLLAVDLPGHGHSDDVDHGRPVGPRAFAEDVAHVVDAHAPAARLVVGMSLGGLTALSLAVHHPGRVRRLALVDITPGADGPKTAEIHAFLAGPEAFDTFEEILARTVAFNPTRSESSLRRGILHNARRRDDGRWVWRHQRERRLVEELGTDEDAGRPRLDVADLWEDVAALDVDVTLFRGDRSPVVDDADVARFTELAPSADVVVVPDAGHSIQGDQPLLLARHLRDVLAGT